MRTAAELVPNFDSGCVPHGRSIVHWRTSASAAITASVRFSKSRVAEAGEATGAHTGKLRSNSGETAGQPSKTPPAATVSSPPS